MRNLNEPLRKTQPEGEVISLESRRAGTSLGQQELMAKRDVEGLKNEWTIIQAEFVDNPRKSVEKADQLILSAIQQISENFNQGRSDIEKMWNKGEMSTEDLRVALQQYRAYFDRLTSL